MQNDLSTYYRLIEDVDCSNYTGFDSIGSSGNPFNANLNGEGHIIKNLTINESSSNDVGLIGYIGGGGNVKKIGLKNVEVSGNQDVGGLIGENHGSFENAFSTGSVDGSSNVGGLIGRNSESISKIYSTAGVSGDQDVGGLIGYNDADGNVSGSYSTGGVLGDQNVGGLIGKNDGVTSESYWDTESSGTVESDRGVGLTTYEMTASRSSNNLDLDFDDGENDFTTEWVVTFNYPKLEWQNTRRSSSNPYEISTCQRLQDVRVDLDAYYELVQNVDCSDTVNWNESSGFDPIGGTFDKLIGSFDGNGYSVDELYINRSSENYVGLFGSLGGSGNITNVAVENVNITGSKYTAGLVGNSNSESSNIINVSSSGVIQSNNDFVGGVVGKNNANVSYSFSRATVTTSGEDVGGLVGDNGAVIFRSYSTGYVNREGGSTVYEGALVGGSSGTVTDSYSDTENSGTGADYSIGLNTNQMTYPNAEGNMSAFDFSKRWSSFPGRNDGYPFQKKFCSTVYSCNLFPDIVNFEYSPEPLYLGDSVSYSVSTEDQDGTIQNVTLIVYKDGGKIYTDTKSEKSSTWSDVATAEEGNIKAKIVAVDNEGASTTEWINKTLVESSPAQPTIEKPSSNSYVEETIQFDVKTSSDGDDKLNEALTCTVYDNGNQVDQYTVTEGSSLSGEYTLDTKGSHTFESVCVESDGESSTQTTTFDLQNFAPDLTTAEFVDDRESGTTKLLFGLDDKAESDIDSFSGTGTLNSLTSSVLDVGVSLPVSSSYSVSDTDGVSSNSKTIDVSESDSGVREDGYSHTLDDQRINRTVTISNGAASPVNYSLTTALPGSTVVQGQSFSGTISASSSVTHTSVTQDEWITEETQSTYTRYSDSDYNHTENQQRIHNRTQLVVDNSRSFAFSDVDVSSVCTKTTTTSVSSGNDVLVTDDCSRPTFTVDLIDASTTAETPDASKNQTESVQYLDRSKTVTEAGGYSWSNVDIFSSRINGSCSDCGTRTRNIAAGESVTETYHSSSDWINDSVSQESADSSYGHDLGSQGTYIAKELTESGGYNWTNISVPPPEINGSCVNCELRNLDFSPGESTTEYYNASSDWIVNESESVFAIGQNTSAEAVVDQQTLYNQTQLRVDNTRNFSFSSVDISSKCTLQTEANLSSGESVVTEECSNTSFSGDWIKNEQNQSTQYGSGEVIFGKGLSESFTATQAVEGTNVRTGTDLRVDVDPLVSDIPGCSVVNSTQRDFPADSVTDFTFHKSCSPGSHLNRTPVTKTETESFYKYEIRLGFDVNSNLTEEQSVEYAVKTEWADNWNSRDPTETEAVVDGSSKDITLEERIIDGTEYIIFEIGENHTNSSIHEGTHSATLTYYESKSPGSTSGGSSSGGGGSGSGGGLLTGSTSETQVDEVTSSKYNWTVSAITSEDAQSFQISGYPGATFEKYVVVRNTGDSNVTLDIDCVSVKDTCSWVNLSVDRVVLNRNSFSEKQIKVSGTVPPGFDSEDAPAQFGIRVSDPEFNGSQSGPHVGYVDFTVTNSPVLGRLLDGALKALEVRSFESPVSWGHPVPYLFIFIPLFWSILVNGLWSLGEWLLTLSERNRWWSTNLKWVSTVLVFLFTYILVP
jgi:hypothetical protein